MRSTRCTRRACRSPFRDGDRRVHRLFDDVVAVEKQYFAATDIFPIMHVVVLRSDVYERHRWVAQSLYKAFLAARDEAYSRIYDSSALRFMEPWLIQHLEEARQLLGDDYWSYGLAANEKTLDVFLQYHHEQGLSPPSLPAGRSLRRRDHGSIRHLRSGPSDFPASRHKSARHAEVLRTFASARGLLAREKGASHLPSDMIEITLMV